MSYSNARGRGGGAGRGRGGIISGTTDGTETPPPDYGELPPAVVHSLASRNIEASVNQVRLRLPGLNSPSGPPIVFNGLLGGMMAHEITDPRLHVMSIDFPVPVHPLRIPNVRAQFATGSSVIDLRFLRMAGMLRKMVPVREGTDRVKLRTLTGSAAKVYGKVPVKFDAPRARV